MASHSDDVVTGDPSSSELDEKLDDIGAALDEGLLTLRTYNDQAIYDLEMENIFGRSWLFVGHESEIPEPGDYVRRYLGDNPFIFVRDEADEFHVFHDSCRHRGAQFCRADRGNSSHFRCPYHGWTYRNDGELIGVPDKAEGFTNLDNEEWGLIEAPRVHEYRGLVFASLAEEGPSWEEHVGDLKWYLDVNFGLTEAGMEVVGEPWRWTVESNWKVGAENSSGDGYHTHIVHKSVAPAGFFDSSLTWAGETTYRYISEVNGQGALWRVVGEDFAEKDVYFMHGDEVKEHINPELTDDQREVARRSTLAVTNAFPHMAVIHTTPRQSPEDPTQGFLSIRLQQPKGPNQTEIWRWVFAPKEASDEYKEVCHRNAMASFSPTGGFSPDDISIWESITEVSGGSFTKQNDIKVNAQAGMDGMSDPEIDGDWPGPGVSSKSLHEGYVRTFHTRWYDELTQGRG
jgi:phenylpropionate dioxygenase-like ring-hydroxylating dioxygenase large terminal subunit